MVADATNIGKPKQRLRLELGKAANGTTKHRGPDRNGRIGAAFRRMYDASPEKLDELAAAAHERALQGDASVLSFIRDSVDGKPIQRTDITTRSDARAVELTEAALSARIAALEGEVSTDAPDHGTTH